MCLLPLIITLYVKFRISCRLCNNFFNIFLIFIKKLLTKFSSHSIISNVSGTRQNTKDMREWLSWWSTTLPRSGPRVRVPSRALSIEYPVFRLQSTTHMREWLSWWSTTLPRSGPRVRVPSRALFFFPVNSSGAEFTGFFLNIIPLSSHLFHFPA